MNKCLKIVLLVQKVPKDFLKNSVQKHAHALKIEGTVQMADESAIKIIACGKKNSIDAFLDVLHKEAFSLGIEDIAIEPFLKEKDYRGAFRVIE